jgi:hypothetical protein
MLATSGTIRTEPVGWFRQGETINARALSAMFKQIIGKYQRWGGAE